MRYIIKLHLARKLCTLDVVDARTGKTLLEYPVTAESGPMLRNDLCERLSEEADEVTGKTFDWRS